LGDDVNTLRDAARATGKPFKEVVNYYLRLGLEAHKSPAQAKPFVVQARPLGLPPGLSYDNVEELLEQLDGCFHK